MVFSVWQNGYNGQAITPIGLWMITSEEATAEDKQLRWTVLTIIAVAGLAGIGTLLSHRWEIMTDFLNPAAAFWSCGFVVAAIAMATHRPRHIPLTMTAYGISLLIAVLICCRKYPAFSHACLLDYINWGSVICFIIPPLGTLAAGALIRYSLWLISIAPKTGSKKR